MKSVHIVLANIRSALNVGSVFRSADAFGIAKIWLAGYTPTPEHTQVGKTALGAERTVAWECVPDPIACFERLRAEGVRIAGFECGVSDASLPRPLGLDAYRPQYPIALVFGNEVEGLSKMQLACMDDIVYIPQRGMKESLNVAVAAGIAMWFVASHECSHESRIKSHEHMQNVDPSI